MRPVDQLENNGFVVLPELVGREELAAIRAELAPHLTGRFFGRNDFEGLRSERVYALLAKAPSVAVLVEHPAVLELVDAILHPNYLLSANLAINVHPGETAQMLHADDGYCRIPRPRAPMGISAIWAIDEFTQDNGATELIPGSHTWAEAGPDAADRAVQQITMPAGSAVVFMGTLLHRGGANRSNRTRLGITPPVLRALDPPNREHGPRRAATAGVCLLAPCAGAARLQHRSPFHRLRGRTRPATAADTSLIGTCVPNRTDCKGSLFESTCGAAVARAAMGLKVV